VGGGEGGGGRVGGGGVGDGGGGGSGGGRGGSAGGSTSTLKLPKLLKLSTVESVPMLDSMGCEMMTGSGGNDSMALVAGMSPTESANDMNIEWAWRCPVKI